MDFFLGILLGAVATILLSCAIVDNIDRDMFQIDAVAHGYATFERDHSWHWNNEAKP